MENLKQILELHLKWFNETGGVRANLHGADLSSANLSSANLHGADLGGADLSSANLGGADLSSANLSSANLSNADLGGANLRGADLGGADLSNANLSSANLSSANLSSADLSKADLRGADLPMYCKWMHSINGNTITIGCKNKTIKEWTKWFKSDEEYTTKRNTPEFKQIYAVFSAYKAYYKALKNELKTI